MAVLLLTSTIWSLTTFILGVNWINRTSLMRSRISVLINSMSRYTTEFSTMLITTSWSVRPRKIRIFPLVFMLASKSDMGRHEV